MNADDPFGLENDAGRTRIRPVRAGPRRSRAASARCAMPRHARSAQRARQRQPSGQRFRRAAGHSRPSWNARPRRRTPRRSARPASRQPDAMRATAPCRAGVPLARADQAAWFVAALLDDIALNTPWGGNSGWPRQPAGRVALRRCRRGRAVLRSGRGPDAFSRARPARLLELVFLCLSLGFRGKHRVGSGSGEAALAQFARADRPPSADRDADRRADLAPLAGCHGRGRGPPLRRAALVDRRAGSGCHRGSLRRARDHAVQSRRAALHPRRASCRRPSVRRSSGRCIETAEQPQLVADPLVFELLPLFAAAAPEGTAQALTGREDVVDRRRRRAGHEPRGVPLLQGRYQRRIRRADRHHRAGASSRTSTSSARCASSATPTACLCRRSNPFRSNQGLSEARARTIADMLVQAGVPAGLVTSEGRAATEPIAENATSQGRARNRRVEIILQKKV